MNHYKPTSIIAANPDFDRTINKYDRDFLNVAEFFCDTIQGEGINTGCPAAFLRLQDCTMNCVWCDTRSVWRYGNPYTFEELFYMMDQVELPKKLFEGQHLVLTGGSPLKQQAMLVKFLWEFTNRYDFLPYIEIENECTLMPIPEMVNLVKIWNNSPKLANSGNIKELRIQPKILNYLNKLSNSWFKFVVEGTDEEWQEIEEDFLPHIKKSQIILMPMAGSRAELERNRERVVQLTIQKGVRYCTREHVEIWDKMTGV